MKNCNHPVPLVTWMLWQPGPVYAISMVPWRMLPKAQPCPSVSTGTHPKQVGHPPRASLPHCSQAPLSLYLRVVARVPSGYFTASFLGLLCANQDCWGQHWVGRWYSQVSCRRDIAMTLMSRCLGVVRQPDCVLLSSCFVCLTSTSSTRCMNTKGFLTWRDVSICPCF